MENYEKSILLEAQQGELDAVLMYRALAKVVKDPEDAKVFERLASDEERHAKVFENLTGERLIPKKMKATFVPLLYHLIGKRHLYTIIAQREYGAVRSYESVAANYRTVDDIRRDEKKHGDAVKRLL